MTTSDTFTGRESGANEALDRLRRFGGDELVREMAVIFYETSHERLADARAGIATGNRAVVARAAHSLKGSCGQIGALSAERLCRDLERAAPEAEPASLLSLTESVDQACAEYRAWLARELRTGVERK